MPVEPSPGAWRRARASARVLLLGKPRDFRDPAVHHRVSLVAFLAWVGLGADGLSSSCYGPEEAFHALGGHPYLALVLAVLVAVTVLVIAASYTQIIELFPGGGGGYLVASTLLGPSAGLVSGCALVVDYVLTIAISVASGADALFSFLPADWAGAHLGSAAAAIVVLIVLNLRGVRESVLPLVPVFLVFLLTHAAMILHALLSNAANLPATAQRAIDQTSGTMSEIGLFATVLILLRAFTLGGGTFTGIEAVSNGLPILRPPRVETARRTMRYMAVSLAATASGLLVAFLLVGVGRETGRTLNASLFYALTAEWSISGVAIGPAIVAVTLFSEAALLFVAAQAGFLDGPRVLASMALDFWVPTRFSHLSDRLVTQDGVLLMGLSGLVVLFFTGGDVRVLVVLYAINVFLTFSLSQLGMVVHWAKVRGEERAWRRKLALNGLGLTFTATILVATLALKFLEGGWVTVLLTGGVVLVCLTVHRHYGRVRAASRYLDDTLINAAFAPEGQAPVPRDPHAPTAVLLVNGFNGMGVHSLFSIVRRFPAHFRNLVFVEVGILDSNRFKGRHAVRHLEKAVRDDLDEYVRLAGKFGFHAESRHRLGTDAVSDLEKTCLEVAREFPSATFFAGSLVLSTQSFFARFLHNQTARKVEERLQRAGLLTVVLPFVVSAR